MCEHGEHLKTLILTKKIESKKNLEKLSINGNIISTFLQTFPLKYQVFSCIVTTLLFQQVVCMLLLPFL